MEENMNVLKEFLENIMEVEEIVARWDQKPSRRVLHKFLEALGYLQKRVRGLIRRDSPPTASYARLFIRSHNLIYLACNRLRREFHHILSSLGETHNADYLNFGLPSSSLSDIDTEDPLQLFYNKVSDLRSIADCMIDCGYSKECSDIYKLVRRSVVEQGVYKLGFDRLSFTQLQKSSWAALETIIPNWVSAAKAAVRVLFLNEWILCNYLFCSTYHRETLFSEVAFEAAAGFFAFADGVATKVKLSPEKMFRFLDMSEALLELQPDIEAIFSQNLTAGIRTQVDVSLRKLPAAIRFMFDDLASGILEESSKLAVPGGGVHPLVHYLANYVSVLSDYGTTLENVIWEKPIPSPPFPNLRRREGSLFATGCRLSNLLDYLLCNLDSKAELYDDPALGYLFLANNLTYQAG